MGLTMHDDRYAELERINRELDRILGDNVWPSEAQSFPIRSLAEALDFLPSVPTGITVEELFRLASEYRRTHPHPVRAVIGETDAARAEHDRLLALLERDVASTIGEEFRHWVGDSAENARENFDTDAGKLVQRIVDEVQQDFMDTFVDVTWPSCPRHPNHPLWFHDGAWYCDTDHERLAELGGLEAIGAGATGREVRRAREAEPRPSRRRKKSGE